jgi:hypothetical protein
MVPFPSAIAIAVLIAFIMFGGDLGLIAWPSLRPPDMRPVRLVALRR